MLKEGKSIIANEVLAEKGGKEMAKELVVNNMVKEDSKVVAQNKGGNNMLLENKEIRNHCLHCNAVLTKKSSKYCDRKCYNSSRKANAAKKKEVATIKTHVSLDVESKETVAVGKTNNAPVNTVVKTPVAPSESRKTEAPVSVSTTNDAVTFEKALKNMQRFGSALTLNRLKKLVEIAGERAHIIRVGGGIVIHWVINKEGYVVYYAPGKHISYKKLNFKGIKGSIEKLMAHKTYKDSMSITEYIALAEKMKGGE